MLVEALLRRLVVVWRDRKNSVGAHALDSRAISITFRRIVAARATQDRHLALGFFDRDRHDAQMLLVRQRGAFSRRAAGTGN